MRTLWKYAERSTQRPQEVVLYLARVVAITDLLNQIEKRSSLNQQRPKAMPSDSKLTATSIYTTTSPLIV